MKHLLFTVLIACGSPASSPVKAPSPVPAQAGPVDESAAMAAYEAKQWPKCAALYEAIAGQTKGEQRAGAIYNAACCHAQGGTFDAAFALLDRGVKHGMKSLEHVKADTDLAPLHTDKRWPGILAGIERNVTAWESTLGDPALRREILTMMVEDQKVRMALIKSNAKPDQAAMDALKEIDTKTTTRMKAIIAKHGWPGTKLVGPDGSHAAWLLVQHADLDLEFQKQCLALIEKAVAAGQATARNHAYLYDRVAAAENRPQRFGTQFIDGEPRPIEDEANVDARRAAIGLPSMADYKKQMRAMYGDKM
ncbi:MAG: hypothetical protein H0V17_25965 [Deltaproteobacteria bacterium]|nr:hypothetical protein [Deltaproteobacteria bacterium]